MDRYRGRLYAFCHRNLGLLGVPDGDVDDVFQETWLRVVRSADRFDARKKFSTWLFTIAVNLCRDARRRRRIGVGDEADVAERESAPEPDEVPEAFSRLAEMDRQAAVEAMLARLPEAMREVLVLRYYEDMDLAQIAEAVNAPVGTAKSRLFHAIRRVRQMAREGMFDETA